MAPPSELARLLTAWRAGDRSVAPIAELLGLTLLEWAPGSARVALDVARPHHNPMGIVHGGIFADVADAALGCACASVLEAGESFATVDLHLTYLRPVRSGRIVASASVLRRGQRSVALQCDLTDDAGSLLATASATCVILSAGGEPD